MQGIGFGPVKNSIGDLIIGDLYVNGLYRTIVSFDTSALPDNATILSAQLVLKRKAVTGANPFDTMGACYVDITTGGFSNNTALQTADFHNPSDGAEVATINNPAANGDLATGLLNATGLTKINLTGKTQLQVRLHTPTNGNGATHSMSFYSGENASSANRPKLIIVYR